MEMKDGMNKMDTVCPLLWTHLSVHSDNSLRVCCNAMDGRTVVDDDQHVVYYNSKLSIEKIYNNDFYRKYRSLMLAGQWPDFCVRCKHIHEHGGVAPYHHYIRQYKDDINFFVKNTSLDGFYNKEFKIGFIDFSLGNICNLKCRMCSPVFSSSLNHIWKELSFEYENQNFEYLPFDDVNLMKSIFKDCNRLLIQGGEPFITPAAKKLLQFLVEHGLASNINLKITTNLSELPRSFIVLFSFFKQVAIHVSLEGPKKVNSFIREGIEWDKFIYNLKILHKTKYLCRLHINFHTVFQIYNLFSIIELLEETKKLYPIAPFIPTFNYLEEPDFLRADILPLEIKKREVDKIKKYLSSNFELYQSCAVSQQNYKTLLACLDSMLNIETNIEKWNKFKEYTNKLDNIYGKSIISHIPQLHELMISY